MSKKAAKLNEVPVDQIPEVAAYQDVKARYEAFKTANPEFFRFLSELQEEMNQKLEAAEKSVRAKKVSCGDFELFQFKTTYDAEELLQALGRDRFLEVGGTMTTQTVYGVDKARVEASIASGGIAQDVAERVRTKSPSYHKPTKLEIP
jgi:hypothetical protein